MDTKSQNNLNPRFPWRIEKAHWYILFLQLEGILTKEEADNAFERLKGRPGSILENEKVM